MGKRNFGQRFFFNGIFFIFFTFYFRLRMIDFVNVLSRAKKTGRQNHALIQQKALHCKTVVNTYHHIV
jgi:hypothetical protein